MFALGTISIRYAADVLLKLVHKNNRLILLSIQSLVYNYVIIIHRRLRERVVRNPFRLKFLKSSFWMRRDVETIRSIHIDRVLFFDSLNQV